jgi:ankyrin repeat protein
VTPSPRSTSDLLNATRRGNLSEVSRLLAQHVDPSQRDVLMATPLHIAAECDHHAIAALLIENGADVNARDYRECTPLHRAAQSDKTSPATVQILIDKGADINACDSSHTTPLHEAACSGNEAAASLLIKHGASVNSKDDVQQTPLHQAMVHGHTHLARELLANGANPCARDANKCTPRDYLVQILGPLVDLLAVLDQSPSTKTMLSMLSRIRGSGMHRTLLHIGSLGALGRMCMWIDPTMST